MKFGLSNSEYHYFVSNLVEPLKKTGAKIWIFGSRARGDHQKFSDLDVMVETNSHNDELIATIKESFQNSNFPYKVDIVKLNEFAESYKDNFNSDKICI